MPCVRLGDMLIAYREEIALAARSGAVHAATVVGELVGTFGVTAAPPASRSTSRACANVETGLTWILPPARSPARVKSALQLASAAASSSGEHCGTMNNFTPAARAA